MPVPVRAGVVSAAFLALAAPAAAQIDARMFRHPDVSADRIAFVYAEADQGASDGDEDRRGPLLAP